MTKKNYVLSFFLALLVLQSCTQKGNIIPQSSILQPVVPGDPGSGNGGGSGGSINRTDTLFVATYDGREAIFELKDHIISKHTVLPENSRLGSAVLIGEKIYYFLESLRFDALGVSEVYEMDLKVGSNKKISQFHKELFHGVSGLTKSQNILYASVRSNNNGYELYKYFNNQWSMIKDIQSGAVGSFPAMFTELNGQSYFLAFEASSGMELWSTKNDGVLHANMYSGAASSHAMPWFVKDSHIYVTAKNPLSTSYDLYRVDEQGQFQKAVSSTGSTSSGANPLNVTLFNQGAVASCYQEGSGREICFSSNLSDQWSVIDIRSGSNSSNPQYFVTFNDRVYFQAEGPQGIELYRSNGASVELVKDIKAGLESSYPENLMVINNTLYFSAYDQQGPGFFSYDGNVLTRVTLEQKDLKYARSLL